MPTYFLTPEDRQFIKKRRMNSLIIEVAVLSVSMLLIYLIGMKMQVIFIALLLMSSLAVFICFSIFNTVRNVQNKIPSRISIERNRIVEENDDGYAFKIEMAEECRITLDQKRGIVIHSENQHKSILIPRTVSGFIQCVQLLHPDQSSNKRFRTVTLSMLLVVTFSSQIGKYVFESSFINDVFYLVGYLSLFIAWLMIRGR